MSYPCPPCCGRAFLDCGLCNFGRDIPTLEVDVGVGGWVDDACDFCDEVAGQYTLPVDELGRCLWEYHNPTEGLCGGGNGTLRINAQMVPNLVPPWKWEVEVFLGPPGGPGVISRAVYNSSTDTNSEDCFFFGGDGSTDKMTLQKTSDSHSGFPVPPCSGTLSTSIEMWAP